ncbi:hypothetical protein D3C80_1228190 [compost metagenome]
MQSPEGSRLRGFYFRFHPLMIGERGGENTSVEWAIHRSDGEIVFGRQDSEGGSRDGKVEGAKWRIPIESALTLSTHTEPPSTRTDDSKFVRATETLTKHSGHMIRVTETLEGWR